MDKLKTNINLSDLKHIRVYKSCIIVHLELFTYKPLRGLQDICRMLAFNVISLIESFLYLAHLVHHQSSHLLN